MRFKTALYRCGAVLLFLCASASLWSSDTKAPLPEKLLTAKAVYIDNQSGYQKFADTVYKELMKWGRFTVVDSADKSDIALRLEIGYDPDGYDVATLRVVDRNGAVLWSNSRPWTLLNNGPKKLLADFRKRLTETH